ncbi:MAG: hypothetical protein QE285_04930 [Aquabacterium sp.]|nr:hypothetical protein [Aquabacterium sp.]
MTGLPAGLTVVFGTRLLSCVDTLDYFDAGSVTMTSRVIEGCEPVRTDTGFEFKWVSRTVDEGTVMPRLAMPLGPCLGVDGGNHDLELSASVRGSTDPAQPTSREVDFLPRVMMNSNLHFTQHLAARSRFVLLPGQTGPVTITRGVANSVSIDNLNLIGTAAIRMPSLSLVRKSGPLLNRQLARLWLNERGRTCITAGSRTVCQGDVLPATPSGAIVHAGIALRSIVARTSGNDVPANTSRAQFSFKLPALFSVGTFNLVANADDIDIPLCLVNGVPTALDLLPWQSAVHDVAVQ